MKKHGKWAIIMAHKVIILYRLYMPYYFLGTFTEYPKLSVAQNKIKLITVSDKTTINTPYYIKPMSYQTTSGKNIAPFLRDKATIKVRKFL